MELHTRTIPMEQLAELITLQLDNGGRASLTVTGYSMMPLLRQRRDAVELILPSDRQKKGDIILYRRENGQYVLHRIIALTEGGYICCGDNQASREPVAHSQLIGVVDGYVRKGKKRTLKGVGYRLYRWIWVNLFFLRPGYIWLRRHTGKVLKRLRK